MSVSKFRLLSSSQIGFIFNKTLIFITSTNDFNHQTATPIVRILYQNKSDMKIMIVLIIISLLIALGFLAAFVWATRSGQFDDDYTPSVRMLFDDEKKKSE